MDEAGAAPIEVLHTVAIVVTVVVFVVCGVSGGYAVMGTRYGLGDVEVVGWVW